MKSWILELIGTALLLFPQEQGMYGLQKMEKRKVRLL